MDLKLIRWRPAEPIELKQPKFDASLCFLSKFLAKDKIDDASLVAGYRLYKAKDSVCCTYDTISFFMDCLSHNFYDNPRVKWLITTIGPDIDRAYADMIDRCEHNSWSIPMSLRTLVLCLGREAAPFVKIAIASDYDEVVFVAVNNKTMFNIFAGHVEDEKIKVDPTPVAKDIHPMSLRDCLLLEHGSLINSEIVAELGITDANKDDVIGLAVKAWPDLFKPKN